MKTPLTEGRSNRRRMTAAAWWVGTPAIAEMAEGPHLVARPVILCSMGGLRGWGDGPGSWSGAGDGNSGARRVLPRRPTGPPDSGWPDSGWRNA